MKKFRFALVVIILLTFLNTSIPAQGGNDSSWPVAKRDNRPWTRWWWLGSAVDKPNLSRLLTEYNKAGIGGVEICPIYGVKGYESHNIDFLSPKWMEILEYTTSEAGRLGMGVDMTTGTGWPFGGPWINTKSQAVRAITVTYALKEGERLSKPLPEGLVRLLIANSNRGESVDLTAKVDASRMVGWTAPAGEWQIYAIVQTGPAKKVKRAAPGGVGNIVDPFSVSAMDAYLKPFSEAFSKYKGTKPRSQFHDSWEYDPANWTDSILDEFKSRRGYELKSHIPALFGNGSEDEVIRVQGDYRQTLNELQQSYLTRWTEWCHKNGMLSRNQAHGAPSNLVDLYAASDIPETETWRNIDQNAIPLMKFASSATNLKGRILASSEAFTWRGEHFCVSLAQLKPTFDLMLLAGINHIIFHGSPYTPEDAVWPGWQFYASTEFTPMSTIWRDLPAFTAYVTRCQSIMQSGRPANDVLLYYPFADHIYHKGPLLKMFGVGGEWARGTKFIDTAMTMIKRGYGYDYVSDKFLSGVTAGPGGVLSSGGNSYRVIVVPQCHYMPEETFEGLLRLAGAGAVIIFEKELPSDVPGFNNLEARRVTFKKALSRVKLAGDGDIRTTRVGRGRIMVGPNVDAMLSEAKIAREVIVDTGIAYARRRHVAGHHYFITNMSEKPVEGWVRLGTRANSVVILDPLFVDRTGRAAVRNDRKGTEVFLQVMPGEAFILRTFTNRIAAGPEWLYESRATETIPVTGPWKVQFIEGGPKLPAGFTTSKLDSWTNLAGEASHNFSGTALYSTKIIKPAHRCSEIWLDLGRVCESARIRINGKGVATLWSPPFRIPVSKLLRSGENLLEIEVTNLSANRIADLDRRKVEWKIFQEINFVNIEYRPFDASSWPVKDSGLIGPVIVYVQP